VIPQSSGHFLLAHPLRCRPVTMHIRDYVPAPLFAFITWVGSTTFAIAAFWLLFGSCVLNGCVDTPLEPDREPQSRVVASWDPLACGEPHRVVVELEDDDGAKLSSSVPCEVARMTIDVPHWGIYRGRIYAWALPEGAAPEIRSVAPVRLEIDAVIVDWFVETPR
jgi:hypothetical protein